jgi:hypothetical protein
MVSTSYGARSAFAAARHRPSHCQACVTHAAPSQVILPSSCLCLCLCSCFVRDSDHDHTSINLGESASFLSARSPATSVQVKEQRHGAVRAQQEAKRAEWRQAELDKVARRDAPKETMRKKVANARADGRGEAAGRVRLQERL